MSPVDAAERANISAGLAPLNSSFAVPSLSAWLLDIVLRCVVLSDMFVLDGERCRAGETVSGRRGDLIDLHVDRGLVAAEVRDLLC